MDDEGVLVPVVVRDDADDPESHACIERLGPEIASSHLCLQSFQLRRLHRLPEELLPDPFSSLPGDDGKRDDVSLRGEDDVTPDLVLLITGGSGIDKKISRVEGVKVDERGPIVWRLGEGFPFDFENSIQVGEGEGPNHQSFFIPEMMEAIPPVSCREKTFANPDFLINSSYSSAYRKWKTDSGR